MNFGEIGSIFIRSLTSLLTLFLVTKLIGKKQASELSIFDYVIGISIGNFAAEMTINLESQFINGIIAVVIFGFVSYLVSILTIKSIKLRRFFIGVPTILVQNGRIIEGNLRKVKFDVNDLLEECRSNGYFDLSQIDYAIMEVNGKLSILPKGEYVPVTIKDMKLKASKSSLCANVIIDSNIMVDNLKNMNKSIDWLNKELKVKGYKSLDNILLATLDNDEKLVIYEKGFDEKVENVLE